MRPRIALLSQQHLIMHAEANTYSHRWFDFFHVNISEARTMQEAAFVCRCAPLPGFRKIADVCCGMGRHARAFSKHGYPHDRT